MADFLDVFTDGQDLGRGRVFSDDRNTAVYRCLCGREQSAAHEQFWGGIDEGLAAQLGWVRGARLGWACPWCSGAMLRKALSG